MDRHLAYCATFENMRACVLVVVIVVVMILVSVIRHVLTEEGVVDG